eukprot:CCRYP_019177-RA/>CCRYP_019177-RA protein AED:0.20 eAED:0.19 QI:0/-1/0/1/-1/1/1/0/742
MATGGRSTSTRGGYRRKPQAHKRGRRGSATSNIGGAISGGTARNAIANQRESYRDRRTRSRVHRNATTATNRRRNNSTSSKKNAPKRNDVKPKGILPPIKVRTSGIMIAWKKSLGGLIRYYVYKRMEGPSGADQTTAEEEIDRMYYKCRCSVEDTKMAIFAALGVPNSTVEWVDLSMAIEKDESMGNIPTAVGEIHMREEVMNDANPNTGAPCRKTVDGKGIVLSHLLRPGEGPAHTHEQWTTIIVPQWAVGKSYYFQVKNNSPLDLSCELFLDGEQVAFNAPIAANSTRTIRPDGVRYYQRHQWILNDAKRVKLGTCRNNSDSTISNAPMQELTQVRPRYNGLRPDYAEQRISLEQYPDPTTFGWKFTGSVQRSHVEFFDKKMNDGGVVKLDFYYTTGTVKTVLDHPAMGRNQLFRAQVSPEEYRAILENPRKHTGKGYRRKEDRPVGGSNGDMEEMDRDDDDDDEFDRVPTKPTENEKMETADCDGGHEVSVQPKYYARDDNYDFKTQGHKNRRDHMNRLQQSGDYAEWKEASKREYAIIHAKFYVSIPKRTHRSPTKPVNDGQRKGKKMEPLPVPEQATFVDIKAAENCTLGTKYRTTGPPQVLGRSNVRMERINGLTDDKAFKGDPVFEKKLYYRAENIVHGKGLDDDIDDEMSEDEDNQGNNPDPMLDEYKTEKIEQVEQYYSDLSSYVADEEEAEQLLRNAKNKIYLSESIKDVDESVNLFYSDLIHRQFDSNGNN